MGDSTYTAGNAEGFRFLLSSFFSVCSDSARNLSFESNRKPAQIITSGRVTPNYNLFLFAGFLAVS